MTRTVLALAAALFLLLPAGPALAAGEDGARDQIVITGEVKVEADEVVGDVVVIEGRVDVAGRVTGDLVAVAASVRLTGSVEGDLVTVAERATLSPRARVDGDLVYVDERPIVPARAAVGGEVRELDWDDVLNPFELVALWLAIWLAVTVSSLILGLLLLWLGPRAADAAVETARSATGKSIGWGFIAFFGIPIASVIALVTLVGIPLGLTVLPALFLLYSLGYLTSAWLLGRAIVGPPRGRVVAFLAGWAILRVVDLIPFLDALAWFGATVFGLGVLVITLWRSRKPRVGSPVGTPAGTPAPA